MNPSLISAALVSTELRAAGSSVACLTGAVIGCAECQLGPTGSENGSETSEDGWKGDELGSEAILLFAPTSAESLGPRNPRSPNSEWWLRTPVRPGIWHGSKGFPVSPDTRSQTSDTRSQTKA